MFVSQVVVYVLQSQRSCFIVYIVVDVGGARNEKHALLAMLGHSCTLLGFSGGLQIGQTLRPTQKSVIQEDCVVKVLRCIPTIPHLHPRSPVRVSGHTTPHPDNPVATTSRVGPPPGTPVHMKPHRSGPGIARASRTSHCPFPGAPHLTDPVPP